MLYPVRMTRAATLDLEEICRWIAENDSLSKAEHVLDRLTEAVESIAAMARRGSRPRELPPGIEGSYHQIFFKPYRVIYEVGETQVVIHAIIDGRRNLHTLLLRRLTSDPSSS